MLISNFKTLERLLKPIKVCNLYHFKPVEGFSIDSRIIQKGQAYIAVKGKHQDGHNFIQEALNKGASFIIAQKYIPLKPKVPFYVVEDSCDSLGKIISYIRLKKKPLVCAVTGSIGKTTTKEMLSFLLESRFKVLKNRETENNLLGAAKTFFSLKDEKAVVFELGTNAKGEIEFLAKITSPNIGIITFVKPVHLDGLCDLEGVLEEKASLFKNDSQMKVILNRDDPYLAKIEGPKKVYWIGKSENNDFYARLIKRENGVSIFLIQGKYELSLPCYREEFIVNCLAAIAGAYLLGIPVDESVKKMNVFKNSLPMRMQMSEMGKFTVLNDAYNSNPYSVQQALKALRDYPLKKVAVIGDMLELGRKTVYYHQQLAPQIIKNNFDYCLTFGEYSCFLKDSLRKSGYENAFHFNSHQEIAGFINEKIGGKTCSDKRYLIFLKGSRKMELEKVVNYLNAGNCL